MDNKINKKYWYKNKKEDGLDLPNLKLYYVASQMRYTVYFSFYINEVDILIQLECWIKERVKRKGKCRELTNFEEIHYRKKKM